MGQSEGWTGVCLCVVSSIVPFVPTQTIRGVMIVFGCSLIGVLKPKISGKTCLGVNVNSLKIEEGAMA